MDMYTKVCSKCGLEKPFSEFNKWCKSKDGHRSICRFCDNIEHTVAKLKKRSKENGAYIEPGIDEFIDNLLRTEWYCWYCNKLIMGSKHVDHITPLSCGGSHSKDNIAIACGRCNDSKGTNSLMEIFVLRNIDYEKMSKKEYKNMRKIIEYYLRPKLEKYECIRLTRRQNVQE